MQFNKINAEEAIETAGNLTQNDKKAERRQKKIFFQAAELTAGFDFETWSGKSLLSRRGEAQG